MDWAMLSAFSCWFWKCVWNALGSYSHQQLTKLFNGGWCQVSRSLIHLEKSMTQLFTPEWTVTFPSLKEGAMVHSEPPVAPGMVLIIPQDRTWPQSCWDWCSCPQALLPPLHSNLNADTIKCPLLNADLCVSLFSQTSHSQHLKFRGMKQMNYPKAL